MPPSPSSRASPGKERTKETHKRGRSLEHGHSHNNKSRDDDLALFNAMQDRERERESFLLHSSDDFDESLNKLRYFSEIKPVNIPARGESSDFLNAEGDKNDYDWLLTPPDTPLFPSLDDEEEPPPLKVVTRGRPQSQTKSLSRSSTIERATQRSSRSSASPSRHSPSPRSSISTVNSSATPTATRRLATPPKQPATRRSASPAPRRISTPSPSKRGISPARTASPKLWQVNPPGFPSQTLVNLKTSVPDRARPRRQSMSPTPSRSASSSHSHDRFSYHSDDVDSMTSGVASGKKNMGMAKNKTVAFSKKPVKNVTTAAATVGSAPKRSFDSALWLMDHRKAPQNMFRPLLSSVPTTSFVGAKSNNTIHTRPVVSRNSSLTTSSNASSDHGAVDQVDYFESDVQEEVFMFDKVDELNEDGDEKLLEGSREEMVEVTCSRCRKKFLVREMDGDVDLCEECVEILNDERVRLVISARNKELMVSENDEEEKLMDDLDVMRNYDDSNEAMVSEVDRKDNFEKQKEAAEDIMLLISPSEQEIVIKPEMIIQKQTSPDSKLENHNQESVTSTTLSSENKPHQTETITTLIPKMESTEANTILIPKIGITEANTTLIIPKMKNTEGTGKTLIIPKMENTEGTGISVLLLQKSSSNKYPVVENKSLFSTTNVQVSEPYYTRDHTSVLKRSFNGSSASSSMDLGPFRNTELKLKRLLSNKSNKTKTPSHISTGSFSDMSVSGLNSSFDTEDNNSNIINNNDNDNDSVNNNMVVGVMSPLVRERNNNVLEPFVVESHVVKSENIIEEINENIVKNEAQNEEQISSKRVSIDEISSPMESSIVEASNDNNNNHGESKAPAGGQRREMRRSFTLEEATDTILFCSSIIHDLSYKAASIAIDKDDSAPEPPPQQPTVTIIQKAPPKEDNLPKAPAKRIVNARKIKRKRPDIENTAPDSDNIKEADVAIEENNNNNNNNDEDSKKPSQPPTPKLEAKCNCVIM